MAGDRRCVRGSALVTNPYLRLAPALVSLLALGLPVLNFRTQAASAKIKPLQHERVHVPEHGQEYYPGGSEVQALATIGAFRVVAADDLRDDQGRPGGPPTRGSGTSAECRAHARGHAARPDQPNCH